MEKTSRIIFNPFFSHGLSKHARYLKTETMFKGFTVDFSHVQPCHSDIWHITAPNNIIHTASTIDPRSEYVGFVNWLQL